MDMDAKCEILLNHDYAFSVKVLLDWEAEKLKGKSLGN